MGSRRRRRRSSGRRAPRLGFGHHALAALAVVAVLATVAVLGRTPTAPAASVAAPRATTTTTPAPAAPAAWFLGDSYTSGAGATAPDLRWSTLVAQAQDWRETSSGADGGGYAQEGLTGTSVLDLAVAGVPRSPDVVVVSGGRNDLALPAQEVAEAVVATFVELRSSAPDARILAVSPVWDATDAPPGLAVQAEAVRTAVQAVGGEYLDVGQPLAGRPELMSSDGIHPDDEGHAALAEAVLAALA